MGKINNLLLIVIVAQLYCLCSFSQAMDNFERDTIQTTKGPLEMTFVGHGTLMFKFQNKIIHIDPTTREADYSQMPKADLILVTHEHGDHLDLNAISAIAKEETKIVLTKRCAAKVPAAKTMKNGDQTEVLGISIEAVPAYNLIHKRSNGKPFHPKGAGNGYILTLGNLRVYIAGDTEITPEMKKIKNIDIAFLPMNLPYTMTPQMVADAARAFRPKILYPYHFGKTDTSKLVQLLAEETDIDIRIRKLD